MKRLTIHSNLFMAFTFFLFMSTLGFAMPLSEAVDPSGPGFVPSSPSFEDRISSLQAERGLLRSQLKTIEQRMNALRQFLSAQKALNLRWIEEREGADEALKVDLGGGKKQPICHARFLNGTHPGTPVQGGCMITYGGDRLVIPFYQLLSGKLKTEWKKLSDHEVIRYQLLEQYENDTSLWKENFIPIQGGYSDTPNFANNTPLYICKARYNGQIYVGKVVSAYCNIPAGEREVIVGDYEILFGSK